MKVVLETPLHKSFRVAECASMFDVTLTDNLTKVIECEVPTMEEEWSIGLIVGGSGSGKTSIASRAWDMPITTAKEFDKSKSVIDVFPQGLDTKTITNMLSSVGFASPPSWIKPYHVLSNGEQFRVQLAHALLSNDTVVFDEFTSVVDRQVAKIGSKAVSRAVRKMKKRFVAVSCHYDIKEWLEPDWVLDMSDKSLVRGRLQCPTMEMSVHEISRDYWKMFSEYHYLSSNLHRAAKCYGAVIDGVVCGFCAVLQDVGRVGNKRCSRLVVLPDYQGIGIGKRLLNCVADEYTRLGNVFRITTSLPIFIRALHDDSRWSSAKLYKNGVSPSSKVSMRKTNRLGTMIGSFVYKGIE